MGRVTTGDAKVESTARRTPCALQIPAIASMSARRMIGLMGVSINMSRVLSRIAASTWLTSLVSTGVTSMPKRGKVWRTSSALPAYWTSLTIR